MRVGRGHSVCADLCVDVPVPQGCRVMCDWWIARWAGHRLAGLTNPQYAWGYFGLVGGYTFLLFLRNAAFTRAMMRASTLLHNSMFEKVLRAPMSFFWWVPSSP